MAFANIETKLYSQDETLFFIRIKGKNQFFEKIYGNSVMKNLFGHIANPHTISEYRNADHHINLNRYDLSDLQSGDYDIYYNCIHKDLSSIIARCRGLRELPFNEAKKLVLLACKYFSDFFQSHQYRLLVIHTIDSYVIDVMHRVARKCSIEVICPTEWFIQGYYRQTFYGEAMMFREPTDDEINTVEQHFVQRRKAFWLNGMGRLNRLRYAMYLLVRYMVLYVIRYLICYRLLGNLSYEYRFAYVWPMNFRNLFVGRYFDHLQEAQVSTNLEQSVVLPLHVYPESNVDYWLEDYRHADYYSGIFETLSFFRSKGITVYVKEHPGFLYQRNPIVYRQLKKFKNVRLIDPFSSSSPLLDKIPLVVVWLGTMGIEALMHGRKVVVFGSNYYSQGRLLNYRDFERARPLDDSGRRELIHSLLSGVELV
jgi:hypothetical protein